MYKLIRAEQLSAYTDNELSLAGRFVRDIGQDISLHLSNIAQVELQLLVTPYQQVPISLNPTNLIKGNCYVVSPYAMYINYAHEELHKLKKPILEKAMIPFLKGMAAILRWANIDRVLWVNNHLVSTNLYDNSVWLAEDIAELTRFLITQQPHHATGFRSLNDHQHQAFIARLQQHGYIAVPSRQVYIATDPTPYSDTKKDKKLFNNNQLHIKKGIDFTAQDYLRCKQLYDQLYLDKYSVLNPHYQVSWLSKGQQSGWLELMGLHENGQDLCAALGWIQTAQTVTTPIFGFATEQPVQLGLYRQLNYLTFRQAKHKQQSINMSSGAPKFKRNRGAKPAIEYSLIYCKHLPKKSQWVWQLLSRALVYGAVPLLKKLEL
ncbi:hypothetical protein VQ643_01405 [Pseudomonas sp. F1_0610]|uniref:hypothetical protein n=1 Tax=Pseudomonas sp. F1_0610 TaxID=3114284 RepID=UPI0039C00771